MAFNINEFKSQLTGGGARSNLFQVQLLNPVDSTADFKVPFMAKAAQLPASTIASIDSIETPPPMTSCLSAFLQSFATSSA